MSESLFEHYKAALRRGHMAALAGDLDEALAAYDAAAQLVPDRALPLASRATVLHRLDRWPEAAEAFDHALQLAPDDEASLRARATARAQRELRSGAAADFERLALVLEAAGRAGPAAEAAGRAVELEPSGSREALAARLRAAAEQVVEPASSGTSPSWPPDATPPVVVAGGAEDEAAEDGAGVRPDDDATGEIASAPSDLDAPGESNAAGQRDATGEGAPTSRPDAPGEATAADIDTGDAEDQPPHDPWAAALDERRLEGLGTTRRVVQPERPLADETDGPADLPPAGAGPSARRPLINDSVAYDMLDALRAGMDSDEDAAGAGTDTDSGAVMDDGAPHADTHAADVDAATAGGEAPAGEGPADGGAWPRIDLPSPPPPPMVGPPPDPEELLAEAALVLEAHEIDAARDLMLTAASVHRAAGRVDAALEICLNLLSIAPGDPRVHLAIANLQLDRGWSAVATEKIDLLVRLTSLTGDTQAEADVHGLASERLRDDPATSPAAR